MLAACGGTDTSTGSEGNGSGSGSGSGNPGGSGDRYAASVSFSLDDGTAGTIDISGDEREVQDEHSFLVSANFAGFLFTAADDDPQSPGWNFVIELPEDEAMERDGQLEWSLPSGAFAFLQAFRPEVVRFEVSSGTARLTRCVPLETFERDPEGSIFEVRFSGDLQELGEGSRTGTVDGTIQGPARRGTGPAWTCP